MIQAADIMREIVEGLVLKLEVYSVALVGGKQKIFAPNTWYLNSGMTVDLGGDIVTVESFSQNEYLILTVDSLPITVGSYTIKAPYFIHGKYEAVNKELGGISDVKSYTPMVWMLELTERRKPSAFDSKFETEGDVRLFLMSSASWTHFSTNDHYTEVIRPLSSLLIPLQERARYYLRVQEIETFDPTNHAKFTTGGRDVAVSGKKVLPDEQSGIEIRMSLPIRKDLVGCVH